MTSALFADESRKCASLEGSGEVETEALVTRGLLMSGMAHLETIQEENLVIVQSQEAGMRKVLVGIVVKRFCFTDRIAALV